MDVGTLTEKRKQAEAQFDELQRRKAEIDQELCRLQGRYEAYGDLIELVGESETKKMVDPATIIGVEESLKESEKKSGSKK